MIGVVKEERRVFRICQSVGNRKVEGNIVGVFGVRRTIQKQFVLDLRHQERYTGILSLGGPLAFGEACWSLHA